MPRDPIDISTRGEARRARQIGELEDQKYPIKVRVGSGPAGAEGPEGKEGKQGPEGKEGKQGPEGKEGAGNKFTFGVIEVTIAKAAEFSAETEIEHKFGATPTIVELTTDAKNVTASLPSSAYLIGGPGATKFKFQVKINGAAATAIEAKKVPVHWLVG
jgi:hypothetical protein